MAADMPASSTYSGHINYHYPQPGLIRRSLPNMAHSILVHEPAKIYPYHLLLITNYRLPTDVDRCNLEVSEDGVGSGVGWPQLFIMEGVQFTRRIHWFFGLIGQNAVQFKVNDGKRFISLKCRSGCYSSSTFASKNKSNNPLKVGKTNTK